MQLMFTGGAYENPSQATNLQRCVNLYPIEAGPGGRGAPLVSNNNLSNTGKYTLIPTPGLLQLVNLGADPIRGMYTVGVYTYVVCGNKVYSLQINNILKTVTTQTLLGTIGTTTSSVYMIDNPTQVILVDGSTSGYIITKAANTMATISDGDFEGGATVAYLDGYFIYNEPNTAYLRSSALNDGTTWDAADIATAEQRPDSIKGLGVFKGELWVFGETTTEVWYNAANPTGFPLSPRIGSGIDVGCIATASIAAIDDLLMWVDSRGYIVESTNSPFIRSNNSGYTVNIISTDALNNEIAGYALISDAIACTYYFNGHAMYQITFPTAEKTWVYDRTTQLWHEKSYYDSVLGVDTYHLVQYYSKYINLNLVGGLRNGIIYLMSSDYYDDNGGATYRIRTTSPQNQEFSLIGVDRLEARINSGYAAQGTDPQIRLRYSSDGGHTWSDYIDRSMGAVGEYGKRITWNRLGTAYEWVFELSTTESLKWALVDVSVKVSELESD